MPWTDLCVRYVILLVTCQEMFWDRLSLNYFITAGGHVTVQFCSEICTASEADLPVVIWCQTFFSFVLRLLFPNNCASSVPLLKREYAAIVCFLHMPPWNILKGLHFYYVFIYLATLNLKSLLWLMRSSSLTSDWTQVPCIGSMKP